MAAEKIYKCEICHRRLKDKPIRLVKQEYGLGIYKQYYNVDKYDFCERCYKTFENWLTKHKEG